MRSYQFQGYLLGAKADITVFNKEQDPLRRLTEELDQLGKLLDQLRSESGDNKLLPAFDWNRRMALNPRLHRQFRLQGLRKACYIEQSQKFIR